jgi:hypothetical protein
MHNSPSHWVQGTGQVGSTHMPFSFMKYPVAHTIQLVEVLHIAQFAMQDTHEAPSQKVPVAQQVPVHGPQTYNPVIP